jgi:hypothetical protein
LLGGGLGGGGLFLPWWHYTQLDGSPFANPSDTGPVILAVTFGLDDGRVQWLLGVAAVAVVAGLLSLLLPPRVMVCGRYHC